MRRFMAVFGALSSLFDAATFAVLLLLFQADARSSRRAGSSSRSPRRCSSSSSSAPGATRCAAGPRRWLLLSSLGAMAMANVVPFTPLGAWFGFVPPPPLLVLVLAGLVGAYLLAATLLQPRLLPPLGLRRRGIRDAARHGQATLQVVTTARIARALLDLEQGERSDGAKSLVRRGHG